MDGLVWSMSCWKVERPDASFSQSWSECCNTSSDHCTIGIIRPLIRFRLVARIGEANWRRKMYATKTIMEAVRFSTCTQGLLKYGRMEDRGKMLNEAQESRGSKLLYE